MADPKRESKANSASKASFNMNELRELADLVDERGFTDFEFENEKIRVRLSKSAGTTPQPVQNPQPAESPVSAPASTGDESEADEEASDGLIKVMSPIVGTFYRSPSPEKPPFVKEGDSVSADTVVCIVEAMKLMNEIQAETSGEIVKVYAEDAQAVEYGQPLFGIRK